MGSKSDRCLTVSAQADAENASNFSSTVQPEQPHDTITERSYNAQRINKRNFRTLT